MPRDNLYTLIPLDDLLKIRLHADFQHGVFSTKKLQLKQWKQRHTSLRAVSRLEGLNARYRGRRLPCRLKQGVMDNE